MRETHLNRNKTNSDALRIEVLNYYSAVLHYFFIRDILNNIFEGKKIICIIPIMINISDNYRRRIILKNYKHDNMEIPLIKIILL